MQVKQVQQAPEIGRLFFVCDEYRQSQKPRSDGAQLCFYSSDLFDEETEINVFIAEIIDAVHFL